MLEDYFDFLTPDDIRLRGTRIGIESVLCPLWPTCAPLKRRPRLLACLQSITCVSEPRHKSQTRGSLLPLKYHTPAQYLLDEHRPRACLTCSLSSDMAHKPFLTAPCEAIVDYIANENGPPLIERWA